MVLLAIIFNFDRISGIQIHPLYKNQGALILVVHNPYRESLFYNEGNYCWVLYYPLMWNHLLNLFRLFSYQLCANHFFFLLDLSLGHYFKVEMAVVPYFCIDITAVFHLVVPSTNQTKPNPLFRFPFCLRALSSLSLPLYVALAKIIRSLVGLGF